MTTPQQIIAANDELRTKFKGGRILFAHHSTFDLDDRTLDKMLCAVAAYDRFAPDSLHDEGVLIFAGFTVCWRIALDIAQERVLTIWVNTDVLNNPS